MPSVDKQRRQIRPSDDPSTPITIAEAQTVLPLGESTYRKALADGILPKLKFGTRTFVRLGDVLSLAKER
jgi:hypothetical protein